MNTCKKAIIKRNGVDFFMGKGSIAVLVPCYNESKTIETVSYTHLHFTQPPARFSEATLVKALEEQGIGRPSTYATIISTIIDREYIEREGRQLRATQLGFIVNDFMTKNFPQIVDTKFTAEMETKLDELEEGPVSYTHLGPQYLPEKPNFYRNRNRAV